MKKIILALVLTTVTLAMYAQEKGFYLTGAGSLGLNSFRYEVGKNTDSKAQLGYGAALGVQYYFNYRWGVATGLGLSYYNGKATFSSSWKNDPQHYSFDNMYDPTSDIPGTQNYTLRLGLDNWTEKQHAYFLEIPLMLMYQTKWGPKESVGMYFGIGAKAQIPVAGEKFEVGNNSELTVKGYTANGVTWGDGEALPERGYGSVKETGFKGDLSLKTGFAASGELGFLITLSRRVDLTVGAYVDYGLNNVKGKDTKNINLIEPENGTKTIHPASYIGDNLQYNGYMNSYAVDKVNLLAYGGKVGVRVKLGKLKERKEPLPNDTTTNRIIQEIRSSKTDTIFMIYLPRPEDTSIRRGNGNGYGDNNNNNNNNGRPYSNGDRPTDDELKIVLEPIFFDLNKSTLKPASIQTLDRIVEIMNRYPKMQLFITGNTCNIASEAYNLQLGKRRANAAREYLENKGISKIRLTTTSQSFHHPLRPNIDEENREMNRRCDFYPTGY